MSTTAVVITCHDLGRTLAEAIESAAVQTRPPSEIVVIDDGSTDLYTRQIVARLSGPNLRVIQTENRGVAASRATGVGATSAEYLVMLDADDVLEPRHLEQTASVLDSQPEVSFVSCATRDYEDLSNVWTPPPFTLVDQLTSNGAHVSTLFRRQMWQRLNGFDGRLACLEDVDFWARAIAAGFRGLVLDEPLLRCRRRRGSRTAAALESATYVTTMTTLAARHRPVLGDQWQQFLLAKERFLLQQREHTTRLAARRVELARQLDERRREVQDLRGELDRAGVAPLDLTDLRRLAPLSDHWGVERGVPVDRHYIESFLERFRADIRGRVAEIKDGYYTARFGGGAVTSTDVIDIDPENRQATITRDLTRSDGFQPDQFDCFVCTQTLNVLYDVRAALATAFKILKPGGIFLCTVSSVNRVSSEDGGLDHDFWRFTEASLRALLAEVFPIDAFDVFSFGNVWACSAFLYGLARSELSVGELEVSDPYFPLIIAIRAVKPVSSAGVGRAPAVTTRTPASTRAVLMYHRVGEIEHDPIGTALAVDLFKQQLDAVMTACRIVPLPDLVSGMAPSDVPLVALTFDDGTIDHLQLAAYLEQRGIPATYFVTTDRLDQPHEHYWDVIEWIFAPPHRLPSTLTLPLAAASPIATVTAADRQAAIRSIDALLAPMTPVDRERTINRLLGWSGLNRPIREDRRVLLPSEIVAIAGRAGQDIGSHTARHPVLTGQPLEVQAEEIVGSRMVLEQLLGSEVVSFCYPFGVSDDRTREVVRSAGFRVAVAVEDQIIQPGEHPLRLSRIDARNESPPTLSARLRGETAARRRARGLNTAAS
jgi:peptidoglycan/xylan/chitin deacetylase (PgdA/CDA1 family)/glycosyltransferase involved in cell wall biosynthesis